MTDRRLDVLAIGNAIVDVIADADDDFIGQLADDQLGTIFSHDIRSLGVEFETGAKSDVGATARCLILVTPDAQRTMNTFLGAAQRLSAEAVDPAQVAAAKILYLEGYLWDP